MIILHVFYFSGFCLIFWPLVTKFAIGMKMSEVMFLLHFPGKDAVYVCRWWKGHACHLSSSSSVMEWWRGDECWRHRGGLRRNSWCVKYQRTIFPGNVPLHPSSLVFVHILISVRVSWPQEKRRVSEPPWSSQSTTCLCVIAESLSFARTVLRLYQRIVLKPVSPAGAILLVKSADHS